jgi:3-deoxy-D-manno-octulosonic-acid transferase
MQNFTDVVRIFLQKDGAVQVKDAAELEKCLGELLASPARRAQLGKNAQAAVAENLGSLNRSVEMILQQLGPRGVYIAPPKRSNNSALLA